MTPRILIVEDDPLSRDIIRSLCESRGHAVDAAADGFLGLRMLSEHRHPIVLVDYHLPEMDGYALARLMREIGNRDGEPLRLVGMSADRDGLAARRGSDALFDAVLAKPIVSDLLFATLERLSKPVDRAAEALRAARAMAMEPGEAQARAAAEAFWRRRGLEGSPRVLVRPEPSSAQAAAIALCFEAAADPAEADLCLVLDPAGLGQVAALRARQDVPLIPAVDLTGRLAERCDAGFRIDDPGAWWDVAEACRLFARRREQAAANPPADAGSPAGRLRLLLSTVPRGITVLTGTNGEAACTYPTGIAEAELLDALSGLATAGHLACRRDGGRIDVRISEQGLAAVTGTRPRVAMPAEQGQGRRPDGARPPAGPARRPRRPGPDAQVDLASLSTDELLAIVKAASPEAGRGRKALGTPAPGAANARPGLADEDGEAAPILNRAKIEDLVALVGAEQTIRLLGQLTAHLCASFGRTEGLPSPLARDVHSLISMTGMLGCDRLSQACRALDDAAHAGDALDAHLAAIRPLRDRTLAAIAAYEGGGEPLHRQAS